MSGNVLPIGYQFELSQAFTAMLQSDMSSYETWLRINGLTLFEAQRCQVYSVSNLYIPKIKVDQDRLFIQVPRIQFWVSFLPEIGTRQFLESCFVNKTITIGDAVSSVTFLITTVDDVSPVVYKEFMEYQSLSPVVVKALRANGTLEYLTPANPYFAQFLIDELIERWEIYHKQPYLGDRGFNFMLLAPERRKAVAIETNTAVPKKMVGYMIKFSLAMSPVLQEFAYVVGLGDGVSMGFGYLELLKKRK